MEGFRCTYRLQLTGRFGFREARRTALPFLRRLGVSHLYLSPVLQARRGSAHGYDVVEPARVSDELGGEAELRALCESAHRAGLGTIVDIVPNHMAVSESENRYWRDPALRSRMFDWDPASGWYRRFFDVDELAGVRVEDPEVFEATHAKTLQLVEEGLVDGLRVDHPDGLAAPRVYLERLRERGASRVWVEKILEPGERLRDWPVEGTTGYEFANDATALFVDPAGEEPLTELYRELTGEGRGFDEIAREAKLELARTTFAREFARLRALHDDPRLEEAAAALHVYRTYVEPDTARVEEEDRLACEPLPAGLRRVVLLEGERSPRLDEFVVRWQQTTAPVMAKGVEDTAFYRWFRLVALNEVGGDPGRFSLAPADFHRSSLERQERHPLALLASQTHDTKRAGDVRARIAALAGMPEEWAARVRRWRALTGGLDDPNEDYLLWQTLVGAWPLPALRLERYLEKAMREGKRTTSWVEPDLEHERRAKRFVRALYRDRAFLDDFEPFAARVAEAGRHISLGQLLLRLTAPGIPDVYQGDALWSFSLVDPDNRRPVAWRRRLDAVAEQQPTGETMKLHLIRRVLRLRAERPEAFAGSYEPLDLGPERVGFVRGGAVRVVVPLRPGDRVGGGTGDLLPEYAQELALLATGTRPGAEP